MEPEHRTDTNWQWRIAKPHFFNGKAWRERVVRVNESALTTYSDTCFYTVFQASNRLYSSLCIWHLPRVCHLLWCHRPLGQAK